MTTPALPLVGLSEDESDLVGRLAARVRGERRELDISDAFYRSEQVIEDLGISIPDELADLHTVCGWGAAAVDPLEERLDIEGFRYPDAPEGDETFWEWWQDNRLDVESSLGHVDHFVHGRFFVAVGSGDGGPNEVDGPPIITPESARDFAVEFDARGRGVTSALRLYESEGADLGTLYLPGQTVHLAADSGGWRVVERDVHELGTVPVVRQANRQRTANRAGSSEITTTVRSLVQSCCRTLLGLEVAREFYAAPRRYVLGASEDAFIDQDGNQVSPWEAYAGRVWGLTRDEDGNMPEVGQFSAYDPTAFTRIIEQYARLMASETGLPPGYLGIATDQPASADAIRMAEQRLVKRAERKQRVLGEGWEDVMRLALLVQTGAVPERARRLETLWRDPATPTRAAQWDATTKGVQSGILPPDSTVTYDLAGLSAGQQQRLLVDRRRRDGQAALAAITARATASQNGTAPAPGSTQSAPTAPGEATPPNAPTGP